jgi:hypothetical protein
MTAGFLQLEVWSKDQQQNISLEFVRHVDCLVGTVVEPLSGVQKALGSALKKNVDSQPIPRPIS